MHAIKKKTGLLRISRTSVEGKNVGETGRKYLCTSDKEESLSSDLR